MDWGHGSSESMSSKIKGVYAFSACIWIKVSPEGHKRMHYLWEK
jgi:hypothetical protein